MPPDADSWRTPAPQSSRSSPGPLEQPGRSGTPSHRAHSTHSPHTCERIFLTSAAVTGLSGLLLGLRPARDFGSISTWAARARNAPTVQLFRPRTENGSYEN